MGFLSKFTLIVPYQSKSFTGTFVAVRQEDLVVNFYELHTKLLLFF